MQVSLGPTSLKVWEIYYNIWESKEQIEFRAIPHQASLNNKMSWVLLCFQTIFKKDLWKLNRNEKEKSRS